MLESDLPERVAQCLARHQVGDQSVAVALSGGIDSMVLLDALAPLKAKNASRRLALTAIHVNHGISANADAWTGFCHAQCAQRGVPLTVAVVEVDRNSGAGLEAAARAARYAALMQSGAAFVLAAQHQDDQAETVLHQMLRGTGLNGLAGMGESRPLRAGQTLLRPLLTSSRAEIEAYATRHKLEWIEDESNLDTAFTRNFIRHELLPLIATRFPHYAESLSRTAQHAAESAELLAALAVVDLGCDDNPGRREVRADILDALPRARQVNALYHWLRWQKVSPPSKLQLADWAAQLFRPAAAGKAQQAGGHGFLIRRRQNRLSLHPAAGPAEQGGQGHAQSDN
ncbi:MAG TPA: tRNA lysidine(34) synthetase TilS [Usitatibacteraceae bacterium]